jgi:hypothetical protein
VAAQVHAGIADNVLPQTATIGVNFRTLPGALLLCRGLRCWRPGAPTTRLPIP